MTGSPSAVWRRVLPVPLPRDGATLLAVLLVADLTVVVLHLTRSEWRFSLENDGGWGGRLGHLQLALLTVLLLLAFHWSREPVHAAWAALVAVLLIDDYYRVHEQLGAEIASTRSLPDVPGLRGADVGELAVYAALGIAVLLPLVVAHRRSGRAARAGSWRLAALLGLLAVFGVVVDLLHVAIGRFDRAMSALEDGGELVVTSLLVVAAFAVVEAAARGPRPGRPPAPSGSGARRRDRGRAAAASWDGAGPRRRAARRPLDTA